MGRTRSQNFPTRENSARSAKILRHILGYVSYTSTNSKSIHPDCSKSYSTSISLTQILFKSIILLRQPAVLQIIWTPVWALVLQKNPNNLNCPDSFSPFSGPRGFNDKMVKWTPLLQGQFPGDGSVTRNNSASGQGSGDQTTDRG